MVAQRHHLSIERGAFDLARYMRSVRLSLQGRLLTCVQIELGKATAIAQGAHSALDSLIEKKIARHNPNAHGRFIVEPISCFAVSQHQRIGYLTTLLIDRCNRQIDRVA